MGVGFYKNGVPGLAQEVAEAAEYADQASVSRNEAQGYANVAQGYRDEAEAAAASAAASDRIISLATVAAMKAAPNLQTGNVVDTEGYRASGDGGGNRYLIGTGFGTADDGSVIDLGGTGLQAKGLFPGGFSVEQFGAVGDNSTDNAAAIQSAIDYITARDANHIGDLLKFGSGIFQTSTFTLKKRCFLFGSGRGASVIKLADGADANLMVVDGSSAMCGWSGLTFDGNAANNAAGTCITIATTVGNAGTSFAPYLNKSDVSPQSYKHIVAHDFVAGNAAEDGIYHNPSNYQVFYDNFTASHCGRDGLAVFSSDCIFSNFYLEKNGRAGLYSSGANNKYSNGKVIWNGRTDKTVGNWLDIGVRHKYVNVEAQDAYTDGIVIRGSFPQFICCNSNQNGYLAVGSEDESTQNSADILVGVQAEGVTFIGQVYSYVTSVGTDGVYTTEWPYFFESFSAAQVNYWNVQYIQDTFNQVPNVQVDVLSNTSVSRVSAQSADGTTGLMDISPQSPDDLGAAILRVFRETTTSGSARIDIFAFGTPNVQHRINSVGDTQLNIISGDVIAGNGAWDGQRLRLGGYYLWVDSAGDLRIKNGSPTSDLDGATVGSQ